METTFRDNSLAKEQNPSAALAKGILWGLLGGLAGTLLMDLLLMGVLFLAGLPVLSCFEIVGDTVAGFFSLLGAEMAGSAAIGVVTHYVIGPIIGIVFGVIVATSLRLRVDTRKKCMLAAILYVEILSQPLLAVSVFLLEMKGPVVAAWYGGAFVMHFILGVILAVMVSHGLRLPAVYIGNHSITA